MARVEFRFWTAGSGYSHSETVDHIDEDISAEEYVSRLEDAGAYLGDYDAINVELYGEDDNLVSEYFWEKED